VSGAAPAPGPHPDDLLPAYALGSLEADETEAVERHLATCRQCAAEVDRLRRTVDLPPLAATPVPPPQGSREALLSRVRRDRQRGVAPARRRPPNQRQEPGPGRRGDE
jgi:anti-sigma factor RsiW